MNFKTFKEKQNMKKWTFILLGILINICLGSVYSWSVFRKPIEKSLQITATQSGLPYMSFLFMYAVTMPFAGKFIDKYRPRWIAIIGGFFVATGWFISGYADSIITLTAAYGLIAGTGVGIIYGVPISVVSKWFPKRKGLAVGLTLLGFGFSPFLTAPLARKLIGLYGPFSSFRYLGITFLIIITILSLFLKVPAITKKEENSSNSKTNKILTTKKDSSPNIFKSPKFYSLWTCYLIGTFAGLMAIGVTSPVAEEIINLPAETAAFTLSLFAVFNGIGRPLFGWLTDRYSPRISALLSYSLIFLASLIMLNAGKNNMILYVTSFSLLWLNLGGWLAIAPAATGQFFSSKNYSKNYGYVFTAYGVGAILGTTISGSIRDWLGSYIYTFYPLLIISIIGIIISAKYLHD